MSDKVPHFVAGFPIKSQDRRAKDTNLKLCYRKAFFQRKPNDSSVITRDTKRTKSNKKESSNDDGLYSSLDSPLTSNVVKPYPLEHQMIFLKADSDRTSGKVLEIVIREVNVLANNAYSKPPPSITSVAIIFKKKVICKTHQPFNRKLHKLFIRNLVDSSNLTVRVNGSGGIQSTLPLPLPERCVKHKKQEIDFAIEDTSRIIYPGKLIYTISLNITGDEANRKTESNTYLYKPSTNDPNDPRNSFAPGKTKREAETEPVRYFQLFDPALCFPTTSELFRRPCVVSSILYIYTNKIKRYLCIKKKFLCLSSKSKQKRLTKPPDIAVAEQMFSLLDISLRKWFQEHRPLRPSSGSVSMVQPKHHAGRKQILTMTILRGVEVPVREESALIQPIVEVEWCDIAKSTSASEGPAPVWQQTIQLEVPTMKMR